MRRSVTACLGAVLLLAACSSSGGKQTRSVVAAPPSTNAPKTSTTSNAIGLHVNADEEAESLPNEPLTASQRASLAAELVVARDTALKYPTVAEAKKAGMIRAGKFTPGAGAHYISMAVGAQGFMGKKTTTNPSAPLAYIYDGDFPTSRIVGLMYGAFSAEKPEGFAGPNDRWHRHTNLCIVYGKGGIEIPFPPDSSVKKAQCDAQNGMFMRETLWMVHTWVVPGWESPQGVFSHANVDLHCGDGTDNTDKIGFCDGAKV